MPTSLCDGDVQKSIKSHGVYETVVERKGGTMSTLFIFTFGIFLGLAVQPKVNTLFALEYRSQVKAICQKFNCEKNEFTYYVEDNDGYYIVSLKDHEYRIKFSLNKPCQIVYSQEVERVASDY